MPKRAQLKGIGERLRIAREIAGISQQEAAEVLRVSRATMANWETGRHMPSLVQFTSLVTLYGAMPYRLLFGHEILNMSHDEAHEFRQLLQTASPELQQRVAPLLAIIGGGES